jgi:hypothetical protein
MRGRLFYEIRLWTREGKNWRSDRFQVARRVIGKHYGSIACVICINEGQSAQYINTFLLPFVFNALDTRTTAILSGCAPLPTSKTMKTTLPYPIRFGLSPFQL